MTSGRLGDQDLPSDTILYPWREGSNSHHFYVVVTIASALNESVYGRRAWLTGDLIQFAQSHDDKSRLPSLLIISDKALCVCLVEY